MVESSAMASWVTMGLWCGAWGEDMMFLFCSAFQVGFQVTMMTFWNLVSMFLSMVDDSGRYIPNYPTI